MKKILFLFTLLALMGCRKDYDPFVRLTINHSFIQEPCTDSTDESLMLWFFEDDDFLDNANPSDINSDNDIILRDLSWDTYHHIIIKLVCRCNDNSCKYDATWKGRVVWEGDIKNGRKKKINLE